MRTRTLLGSLVALALTGPALAQDGFNYSYAELGWVNTELDDFDVDGDGFALRGSFEFTEQIHGFAGYSDQDFDFGVSSEGMEIGAGYAHPLSPNVDVIGRVSYLKQEISVNIPGLGGMSVDDDGFGLGVGLRGRVMEQIELTGGLDYVSFDEGGSDTAVNLGGLYYFTQMFALGAGMTFNDAGTSWMISGRFNFN